MSFADYCFLYLCHIFVWYFFYIFYKLGFFLKHKETMTGKAWFWGMMFGFMSFLFQLTLHRVGYAPLVIK